MPAPDLTDLRIQVARIRRAIIGPLETPPPSLTDDMVYAMAADACADIILYSGGLFGHTLLVTARETTTNYPTGWATETPLDEWEATVIVTQAALGYYFHILRDMKVHETITNEGQTWDYDLSANLLKAQFDLLVEERDKALDGLKLKHPTLTRYASNIRVRDVQTVQLLEWWDRVSPAPEIGGLGGGQESTVIPWTP